MGPVCVVDGAQDGSETGVDCGGGCALCSLGGTCGTSADCADGPCVSGACSAPLTQSALALGDIVTSLDTADGQTYFGVLADWSVVRSDDGAQTWRRLSSAVAGERPYARIHVSRASGPPVVMVSDGQLGSDYDAYLLVSTDGLTFTPRTGGEGWGEITAFSDTEPDLAYFLADNDPNSVTDDAAATTQTLPFTFVNGLAYFLGAGVDPLDSSHLVVSYARLFDSNQVTGIEVTDDDGGAVITDLTAAASSALGGEAPCGLNLISTDAGSIIRIVGDQGAVASSADGSSFQAVGAGGSLASCAQRMLRTSPLDPRVAATWCPGDIAPSFSLNGGATWSTPPTDSLNDANCASISDVSFDALHLILACTARSPVWVDFLGERAPFPDGGAPVSTCFDGQLDGDETDVDCGGSCAPCSGGQACATSSDCQAANCLTFDGGSLTCVSISCSDGVRDGLETGIDCGGDCVPCPTAAGCQLPADCQSLVCDPDGGTCLAPTCTDGEKNADETDVDCGGGSCAPCLVGGKCLTNANCQSQLCASGTCQLPVIDQNLAPTDTLSSLDSADGVTYYAVLQSWAVLRSEDGAQTWSLLTSPIHGASGSPRIQVSRAPGASTVLVTDGRLSGNYDDLTLVSTDGAHFEAFRSGNYGSGEAAALSGSDATTIYLLNDGNGAYQTTNAGLSEALLLGSDAFLDGTSHAFLAAAVNPADDGQLAFSYTETSTSPRVNGLWVMLADAGFADGGSGVAFVDLTGAASAALGGELPCGFVLEPAGDGGAALRLLGDRGAVVVSGDWSTFQTVSADGGLSSCTDRVLRSDPIAPERLATWCGVGGVGLRYSLNGGATWSADLIATLTAAGCTSISDVAVDSQDLIVACASSPAVVLEYADERAAFPDGGAYAATCFDGQRDGDETDVDCGASCAPCADGLLCLSAGDCQSTTCVIPDGGGASQCHSPSCSDGVRNGLETDTDCGGVDCPVCPDLDSCHLDGDCQSGVCAGDGGSTCQVPTCSDGVQNQGESDVDCGGSHCAPCGLTARCTQPSDCSTGRCELSSTTSKLVCDARVAAVDPFGDGGSEFNSLDTVDGQTLLATTPDWEVLSLAVDAGWETRFTPAGGEKQHVARVHISRANPADVVVYGYTDALTSTYSSTVIVTHDGFGTAQELSDGCRAWGVIGAFSDTDPNPVYFLGDNASSVMSSNGGDTTTVADWTGTTQLFTSMGAAQIDPGDSTHVWLAAVIDPFGPDPALYDVRYDAGFGVATDRTAELTPALSGQRVGGFEELDFPDAGYRLRFIGSRGSLAASDDQGATFQVLQTAVLLNDCGAVFTGTRQIRSSPLDPNLLVTWCPGKNDLSLSRNGGARWESVSDTPSWPACGIESAAFANDTLYVGCNYGLPFAIGY